jgi:pilus assembly protein Flp/PilA
MKSLVQKFIANESGATAIEYGLIAVVVIAAVTKLGTNLSAKFNSIAVAVS